MQSLQIIELTIKNYRQYEDENRIDLRCSETQNINVIEGENGTGKSNILNAITLCLFGKEKHQENNVEREARLPYVSIGKLENIEEGEVVEGFIEIKMGWDEPEYIFKRRFRTFKTDEGYSDVFDDLQVKRKAGRDWVTDENPATTRNEILAPRVADYFLFDGEQLQEFFDMGEKGGYKKRVQHAILDVSHIELLDRSKDHLNKVRSDIESAAKDYGGKPGEIKDEIEKIKAKIERKKEQKKDLQESIEGTKTEIERIDAKLQDVADERAKRFYERREFLEQQLEDYNEQLEELQQEAHIELLNAGPEILSEPALQFAEEELEEMSEKGELPPKIRDQFIEELLDRGECICGATLEDDKAKREHLLTLKKEVVDIGDENFEGKTHIRVLLNNVDDRGESLKSYRKKIGEKEKNIEETNGKLKEVNEKLENFEIPDEVDVGALETQRAELQEQRDDLIREATRVEDDISELESKHTSKQTELKEEMREEEKYQELTDKLEFVDGVLDNLREIRSEILDTIRQRTEKNLNEYFNELIWKDTEYTIILEDDYRIQVLDEHGENQLGSLSAGETQVLALSFMAGLSQISGFDSPIVIDTPLGRISGEPKSQIAQNLPNYLEDTQITFLMTDQEYTSNVRGLMEPHVSQEYVLDFQEGVTEVKKRARV